MTREEQEKFLQAITGSEYENALKFLLYSGLRRTELLSIQNSDVLRKDKLIKIHGTKTTASERFIPLTDKLLEIIEKQQNKTKDGFMECLTKGDFADFIGWEYLDVGGKTFAEFEADNFTYKNGNNQIKFYFGTMDVNWSDTPSEPQRFVLRVNSGTSKLNFAKKGGAYYCDAVELNTLPTVKITEVDYGLTGDQRISNIMFMFFNLTKQEFLNAYVNDEDIFGFRNTNVFAMALDFSNPTSEDETSILFSQDGETRVFISFSFKAP